MQCLSAIGNQRVLRPVKVRWRATGVGSKEAGLGVLSKTMAERD